MFYLPHHSSTVRPRMPRKSRAAQFSPFAALTGHEDAIFETGRLTQPQIYLAEDAQHDLDRKQRVLKEQIGESHEISITYFLPDTKKSGGNYITVSGVIKRVDSIQNLIFLTNGTQIRTDRIIRLEGELFDRVFLF